MRQRTGFYALCIVCLLSLFLFLGETLFNTRGESREALVAYSMIEQGNWILPVNNGDEISCKPPLFHWSIAAISTFAGGVNELTSRLPSALALSLMTLAVYLFYARRRGIELALLTAGIMLANLEVHRAGMACGVDMLLAALMVGALLAMYRWTERHERGIPLLAWLCLSGAALTRGPVGALLPCAVVGVYLLMRGRGFWYATWRLSLLVAFALLPLFGWYALAYAEPHGGQRFLDLIYEENVLRLLGQMTYASPIKPWPYNVQAILMGFLPFTLLLLLLLPAGCRHFADRFRHRRKDAAARQGWWATVCHWATTSWQRLRTMDNARLFTLLSVAIIFVFYCIPKSKSSTYLLPLYPFLAYYVAEGILWLRERRPQTLLLFGRLLVGLCGALTLAFLIVRAGWIPATLLGTGKHAAENAAYLVALQTTHLSPLHMAAIVAPIAMAGYFLIRSTRTEREQTPQAWPLCIVGMALSLFLALDGFYLPTVLNVKSDYAIARQIASIQPAGTIYSYRTDALKANHIVPFTINFYVGNRIVPIDKAPAPPLNGLLVTGDDEILAFGRNYPQYTTVPLLETDHRSCDDKKKVKVYAFTRK